MTIDEDMLIPGIDDMDPICQCCGDPVAADKNVCDDCDASKEYGKSVPDWNWKQSRYSK